PSNGSEPEALVEHRPLTAAQVLYHAVPLHAERRQHLGETWNRRIRWLWPERRLQLRYDSGRVVRRKRERLREAGECLGGQVVLDKVVEQLVIPHHAAHR